ncbi:MAG: 30S ribosomal protein S4 [Planctomycetes bacterium]|nr:30S ribosomal protein S4 [Planctomycetota bacterium]
MSRFLGNVCKLCRREGMKLFLKGQRCFTNKCAVEKRDYPPGEHSARRSKVSEYGLRLREKQKLKRIYGLMETQFRFVFERAERAQGNTGENLLVLLERRLDNVLLAAGFALSRNQSRQMISHGHIQVNGRRVTIPSYLVRTGDVITPQDRERTKKVVRDAVEVNRSQTVPGWLEVDRDTHIAKVQNLPRREDVMHPIKEQLIVELLSK